MNELTTQQSNNLVILGQQGLIRKSKDGNIQAIEVEVELSYKNNHFWALEKGNKITYMMTGEGYEYLNKWAGLKLINEPTFTLNGVEFTNPAIISDATGRKQAIYYKTSLGGYAPDGTYHISPSLIHYNVTDELISALYTKINYALKDGVSTKDGKFEGLGIICSKTDFPMFKKECPYAMFIQTSEFMGEVMGVAINTRHKDFAYIMQTQQDKILNIEKKIQTVGKRNAFRKHPATAIYTLNPKPIFDEKGNKLDLVYREKIVMWLKEEEVPVEELVKKVNVAVEAFKDVDVDIENDEDAVEVVFDGDERIVDPLEEEVVDAAPVVEEVNEEELRQAIIVKIEKVVKRVPGYVLPAKYKTFNVPKLNEILDEVLEMEE